MTIRKVVILGAGVSGLVLAWYLKSRYQDEIEITIVEKNENVGGLIRTIEQDGFLFEQGPRSCRPFGAGVETLKLVEELDLQDQVILGDSVSHKRYLWLDQKFQQIPSSIGSFLFSPFLRDGIKALLRDWRAPKGDGCDESIYEFTTRRFGKEIAEKLIDPFVSGIYAGNIYKLSMKSCFSKLFQMEKEYGSIVRGVFKRKKKEEQSPFIKKVQRSSLFSFKEGMCTLTRALAQKVDAQILLSQRATHIQPHPDHVEITLSDGHLLKADHLFFTIPATPLSTLMQPHCPELGGLLQSIPATSLAVVNFGYRKPVLKENGFGYLIPSKENEEILGVVWDSCVFPEQNRDPDETRLTVMVGGDHMSNFGAYSKHDFVDIAQRAIKKHLDIRESPDSIAFHSVNDAIPQYPVGHTKTVEAIEQLLNKKFPRISILGNSYYGVSVNDCIATAKIFSAHSMIVSN